MIKRVKLHNKAANASQKNREFRMKETPEGFVPRDCTFPLSALSETAKGCYKKANATEVKE